MTEPTTPRANAAERRAAKYASKAGQRALDRQQSLMDVADAATLKAALRTGVYNDRAFAIWRMFRGREENPGGGGGAVIKIDPGIAKLVERYQAIWAKHMRRLRNRVPPL